MLSKFIEKAGETPSETAAIALALLYHDFESEGFEHTFFVRRLANSLIQLDEEMVVIFCRILDRFDEMDEGDEAFRGYGPYDVIIIWEEDLESLTGKLDDTFDSAAFSLVLSELKNAGLFLPDPAGNRVGGDRTFWGVGIGEQTKRFGRYLREAEDLKDDLRLD